VAIKGFLVLNLEEEVYWEFGTPRGLPSLVPGAAVYMRLYGDPHL
jgi:hypothetical protein